MPLSTADFLPRGGASKHGLSMAEPSPTINREMWLELRREGRLNGVMEIILLRHAQPRWALSGGRLDADPELTALGHAQADRLAAALLDQLAEEGKLANTRLLVSPLRRTRQTAAPLAERLGLPIEIQPWLAEIRLPMQTMTAPELDAAMRSRRHLPPAGWWAGWPGGEAPGAFAERIGEGLDRTLGAIGAGRVAGSPFFDETRPDLRWIICGHGGTNAVLMGELLGLPRVPWPWERFVLGHASLSRLRSRSVAGHRLFGLYGCNELGHLPLAERTA